jgi:hypothetical protein
MRTRLSSKLSDRLCLKAAWAWLLREQIGGLKSVEIEETDSKVLEVLTPESEHWRGLQPDPTDRPLVRRSLVRAQVGEPEYSRGYVGRRSPFVFLTDTGFTAFAGLDPSSARPIARGHGVVGRLERWG